MRRAYVKYKSFLDLRKLFVFIYIHHDHNRRHTHDGDDDGVDEEDGAGRTCHNNMSSYQC